MAWGKDGPGVKLNVREFLFWSDRMTVEEIGEAVCRLEGDLRDGEYERASEWPFVDGVYETVQQRPGLSPYVRRDVLDGAVCVACGSADDLEVDHILPWSRGGTHDRDNLQALCFDCNRSKGAQTMEEWRP